MQTAISQPSRSNRARASSMASTPRLMSATAGSVRTGTRHETASVTRSASSPGSSSASASATSVGHPGAARRPNTSSSRSPSPTVPRHYPSCAVTPDAATKPTSVTTGGQTAKFQPVRPVQAEFPELSRTPARGRVPRQTAAWAYWPRESYAWIRSPFRRRQCRAAGITDGVIAFMLEVLEWDERVGDEAIVGRRDAREIRRPG